MILIGLFSGGGFLGDVGGVLGINTDDQQDAAAAATQAQVDSSEAAIAEQEAARLQQAELLQPFIDVAGGALEGIGDSVFTGGAPDLSAIEALINETLGFGTEGAQQLLDLAGQQTEFNQNPLVDQAQAGISSLLGEAPLTLDPAVLDSPFFKALQEESLRNLEGSAAARGRLGAGDTKLGIGRSSLLLGQDFAQQDLQNRLAEQGQRFNQLQSSLGLGQGLGQQDFANRFASQQQQFGQTQSGLGLGLGAMSQGVSQLGDLAQAGFGNELAANTQGFNQLLQLLGIGQASAAGVGANNLSTSANIADLLTGIGSAESAGIIGASNAATQGQQNLLGLLSGAAGGAGTAGLLGGSAGIGALAGLSDKRIKKNIKSITRLANGLTVYLYKYIFGGGWQVGYMAQEVEKIYPDAVGEINGIKFVNYGAIPWR